MCFECYRIHGGKGRHAAPFQGPEQVWVVVGIRGNLLSVGQNDGKLQGIVRSRRQSLALWQPVLLSPWLLTQTVYTTQGTIASSLDITTGDA